MRVANRQTAREQAAQASMPADMARVAQHMTRLGVSALPRNYALFHEAVIGQNPALAQDIAALGLVPGQPFLDALGLKYRLPSHCAHTGTVSQSETIRLLRDTQEALAEAIEQRRLFARAAARVVQSLSAGPEEGFATFSEDVDFLQSALSELVAVEEGLTERLREDADRLVTIERGLSAIQAASLTDRLTGLPNRLAFVRSLTGHYEAETGAAGMGLVFVAIDRLEDFGLRNGQQSANRLMKRLADLFRRSIKKNDLVARLEADEFALVFPQVDLAACAAIAERLRAAVADELALAMAESGLMESLPVSIGIALGADAATAGQLEANGRLALLAARCDSRRPIQIFGR